ncbi:MAG: hypothetical protein M1812_006658 [Candelaria pacifica]|nr:MAG: hypothetical protein M1812_006658 [Candelaria pacifica]
MAREPGEPPESPDSASSSNLYSASEGNGGLDSGSISSDNQVELAEDHLDLSSEDDDAETVLGGVLSPDKRGPIFGEVLSESRASGTTSAPDDGRQALNNGHPPEQLLTDVGSTTAQPLTARDFKRKRRSSESSFGQQSSREITAANSDFSEAAAPRSPNHKRTKTEDDQSLSASGGKRVATFDGPGVLPSDKSKLPAEIWHYIFSCVSPVSLGRLLQVNRSFKSYLVPNAQPSPVSASRSTGFLNPQLAEAIWRAARHLHYPAMPKPLRSRSELENWSLIRDTSCQLCSKQPGSTAEATNRNPWEAGPGQSGVRVVWPFGVRCCGSCLSEHTDKEMTLFLSSEVPSFLVPALPFALLTPEWHVIPSTALQNSDPPPNLSMTKYYYKPDIESIKRQLEDVKGLGSAATEEWIKGLDGKGKDRMGEAARWERWEDRDKLAQTSSRDVAASSAPPPATIATASTGTAHSHPSILPSTAQEMNPVSNDHNFDVQGNNVNSAQPNVLKFSTPNLSGLPPRTFNSPAMGGFGHPAPGPLHQPRTERNIHDVNEAKAARRAEIERRCMDFQPPLVPSVLNHMESFQAAILIPTQLTNNSWEVLKPRLLAQRELAERRESERIAQHRASQAKFEERRQQESHLKEAKEVLDREWDEAQAPVRERLSVYADEIIQDKWAEGKSITKDTSPKFAADVLIYTRKRFYSDIAKEDNAARAGGEAVKQDSPNGPPTRKLILENMKWLFDTKIKPLSEHYRKELFLCNGCDNNFKFYGFEGVVQHYAAKHTNTLSMGSIIVHWRAEWPEHPPFHPDPSAAKAAFYAVPTPSAGLGQASGGALSHSSFIQNGYSQSLGSGSQMAPQGPHAFPQFSPGPYGQTQFSDPYSQNQYGPFAPPAPQHQNYPGPSQGFQVLPPNYHHSNANNSNYQSGFLGHPQSYQGYTGPYQGAPSQMHGSPYPAPSYPFQGPEQGGNRGYGNVVSGPYGQSVGPGPPFSQTFQSQAPPVGPGPSNPHLVAPGQPTGIYQVQIEEMAQNARDVWFGTSGIKDLPGSVRIYVVLQHVVTNFKARFTNEPSLAMFTDGLASHALMKPIKSVNGLACKACVNNGHGSGAPFHSHPQPSSGERRLYALPSLLSHFQSIHIERAKPTIIPQTGITTPRLDWKEDMIELPEESMIQDLVHAPGMDDQKLHLIAQAFPAYFPSPLPRIGLVKSTGPVPILNDENDHERVEETEYVRLNSPQRSGRHEFEQRPTSRRREPSILEETSGKPERGRPISLERPSNDDEYDPHRPAYLGLEYHRASKMRPRRKGDRRSLYPEDEYMRGSSRHGQEIPNDLRALTRKSRLHNFDTQSDGKYYEDPYQRAPSRLRSMSPRNTALHATYGGRTGSGVGNVDTDSRHSHLHLHEPSPRDREYSIPPAQVKVSQSPHQNQDFPNPQAIEAGSEDGEVGDMPGLASNITRVRSPPEKMSAAERFLNEFLPGQDADEYKKNAAGHDKRKEDQTKANWLTEQEAERQERGNGVTNPETRSWRADFGEGRTRESSLGETPIRAIPQAPRNGHGRSPQFSEVVRAEGEYDRDPRLEQFSTSRPRERSPELVDPQYVHNSVIYHRNHRQLSDHPRRPRSRYERYEAQRHEDYRTRSRSPRRSAKPSAEDSYYRTRETSGMPQYEPIYRSGSPSLSRTHIPSDDGINYHRVQAQPHYRYVEDSRDYRSAYGKSLEYIPVRVAGHDQQGHDRYVVSRPIERTAISDYVPYDNSRQGEQLYEHNGQVYSRRSRVYQERPDAREESLPGSQY